MMSEENIGGAAFPVLELLTKNGDVAIEAERGMTLRDYFAAKAMQAFISAPAEEWPDNLADGRESVSISEAAYEMADEMLKAREA